MVDQETTRVVLIAGTGRCATRDTVLRLNRLLGLRLTHWAHPALTTADGSKARRGVTRIMAEQAWTGETPLGRPVVGDAGPYWLAHAKELLAGGRQGKEPRQRSAGGVGVDFRVVVLRRDRAATVASFGRYLQRRPRAGRFWRAEFAGASVRTMAAYWDDFYARAEALAVAHPSRIRIFDVETVVDRRPFAALAAFAAAE